MARPVINAALLKDRLGFPGQTAQRAMTQLAEGGVFTERTGFQRNRVWQHEGILRVLDVSAQSLLRRYPAGQADDSEP